MKKLLFVFALFLAIATNAQEGKNFKGAMEYAKLTQTEKEHALTMNLEKKNAIKEIQKSDLLKEEKKAKIKVVKNEFSKKLKTFLGKDKISLFYKYWKN